MSHHEKQEGGAAGRGEKVLPVIDLRLAQGSSRPALVRQLHHALSTVGFIYLTGVDGYDEEELLRLTRWFFRLPIEERMRISKKSFNPDCDREYRGYFPVIPGAVSHKEGFEMGAVQELPAFESVAAQCLNESNQWPGDGTPATKHFRAWMENYHLKMTEAALELMSLIAEGFGAPSDFFKEMFSPTHLSTLRLIRYPPRPNPPEDARDGGYVIQTAEHRDSVMVTLLATFAEYPGLQLRWWEDDSIVDVPHRPGHLVINIGELLASISGGTLKATRHRVIDCCGERMSVPYFLEPKYDGNIDVVLPGGTKTPLPEDRTTYGPWLWEKISKWAENKDMIRRAAEAEAAKIPGV